MLLDKIREFNIPVVNAIKPFDSLDELIAYTRNLENAEGFVVAFEDGHRVKIKADQYVRIHKTVDRIVFDRNIVNLILNEEVDDVVPMLPQVQADRVRKFERHFWASFEGTEMRLRTLFNMAQEHGDRKTIATEFVPKLSNKTDAGFIFRMLDGYNIRELMLQHVEKNTVSNVKWDECAAWMGM